MGLKTIPIKLSYNSYDDDISSFFNTVIGQSTLYRRVAAYFSSTSFRAISRGLSKLVASRGRVKMIVSIILSEEDFKAITKGLADKNAYIASLFSSQEALEHLMASESVEALYRLISNGALEMKFAISNTGIFHMKFGIVEDSEGNRLSFSGSLNETEAGYLQNGEEFKVFRGWIEGERDYVEDDLRKFNRYWENTIPHPDIVICTLPDEARSKISDALKAKSQSQAAKAHIEKPLRPYQRTAVDKWFSNGRKGIMEMATGTGKTSIALEIMSKLLVENPRLVIIVAVPTKVLITQWVNEIAESLHCNALIVPPATRAAVSKRIDNTYWEGGRNPIIILGTYNYLSTRAFYSYFEDLKMPILLVADEVHSAGASAHQGVLRETYDYRLGLSATPVRQFDPEGTQILESYFGGIVYSYGLKDAIRDGYLSEFSYYPEFAELSEEEVARYVYLTRKYGSSLGSSGDAKIEDGGWKAKAEQILFQRAKVVKKAKDKLAKFELIASKLISEGRISGTVVFYEDEEQLRQGNRKLDKLGVRYAIVSAQTGDIDRESAKGRFIRGEFDCICSMRVFDEGVDIGSIRNEIIMSSSVNQRQLVQRIGRAIRKAENKGEVRIYEVSAAVSDASLEVGMREAEKSIVSKEIQRMVFISKAARNELECYNSLGLIAAKLGINIWEFI